MKVGWKRMICNNHALPKCVFNTWLTILGRLTTCDNLLKIRFVCDQTCILCGKENESHDHLLFSCVFSSTIWGDILDWLNVKRKPAPWSAEILYCKNHQNKFFVLHQVYRMSPSLTVYEI